MNKAKGNMSGALAQQTGEMLGRVVLGGLCGVGALWTLTAAWPPSKGVIRQLGLQVEMLSHDYPTVVLGLTIGVLGALLTLAWKKS